MQKPPQKETFTETEDSPANECLKAAYGLFFYGNDNLHRLLFYLTHEDLNFEVGPEYSLKTCVKPRYADKKWAKELEVSRYASLVQQAFEAYFEPFSEEWLDEEKVVSRLKDYNQTPGMKFLFIVSKYEKEDYQAAFSQVIARTKAEGFILKPISYKDFLITLKEACYTEEFEKVYKITEQYFLANDLL